MKGPDTNTWPCAPLRGEVGTLADHLSPPRAVPYRLVPRQCHAVVALLWHAVFLDTRPVRT